RKELPGALGAPSSRNADPRGDGPRWPPSEDSSALRPPRPSAQLTLPHQRRSMLLVSLMGADLTGSLMPSPSPRGPVLAVGGRGVDEDGERPPRRAIDRHQVDELVEARDGVEAAPGGPRAPDRWAA